MIQTGLPISKPRTRKNFLKYSGPLNHARSLSTRRGKAWVDIMKLCNALRHADGIGGTQYTLSRNAAFNYLLLCAISAGISFSSRPHARIQKSTRTNGTGTN
jgi:hypothetical protein